MGRREVGGGGGGEALTRRLTKSGRRAPICPHTRGYLESHPSRPAASRPSAAGTHLPQSYLQRALCKP